MRRIALSFVVATLGALTGGGLISAAYAESPATIPAGQPQFFFDDVLLDGRTTAERTWHACEKYAENPIILPSGAEDAIFLLGTVLYEPDPVKGGEPIFRMWYFATGYEKAVEKPAWEAGPGDYGLWLAYATSQDGIRWEKPNLGLYDVNGSVDNNAVYRPEGWVFREASGVIRDDRPGVPADERYKQVFMTQEGSLDGRKAYATATSPDGIHWTFGVDFTPKRPAYADAACLVWDPYREVYALYCRAGGGENRTIALVTSKDFRTWEDEGVVLDAQAQGTFGADAQIYGMSVFALGGQWLGMPMIYRETNDLGIAHSRDGKDWTMVQHLIVPVGDVGTWDAATVYKATALIPVKNEDWLYYSGRIAHHIDRSGGAKPQWRHGIGLATIRRDGWCSMRPGEGETETLVMTRPVVLAGEKLLVNADAADGDLRVEVVDTTGGELLRSKPITEDSVAVEVVWENGQSLGAVAGKPVQLRFVSDNTALYTWQTK